MATGVRQRPLRFLLIVCLVIGVLYAAATCPILKGWHLSDQPQFGDNTRTEWVGISFYKHDTTEAEEPASVKAAEYPSPCSLYVAGHNVEAHFRGTNAAENCASFVQKQAQPRGQDDGNPTTWTTEAQPGAFPAPGVGNVCELTNPANEHVAITDSGIALYGREACKQLSEEGWIEGKAPTVREVFHEKAQEEANFRRCQKEHDVGAECK
jgi:hypothetical protein